MTEKETRAADFLALSEEAQLKLLRRDGVYIGKLKEEGCTIVLFQLYSFYVEIFYEKYRIIIRKILVSDNLNTLHRYLNQVKVKGLGNDDEKKR